ncbi:hypothetical protein [Clostridium intestinale]|uniref:DUF4345 domain-containing protein n=1 Tax=Clostridium intestinale URNW TaxID=1294142 RepID=U2NRG5_9CLOT|nr:hypothetical protein [Clostridium intestinale]ERK31768.1 hypothetical protein CINTURNW_0878 [Clostridium intestinale URNW]
MKNKIEHNILFIYLSIFLLMTIGAFLWQFFMPDIAEKYSTWNTSKGWQREIALWNLSIDFAIVITLIKKDIKYAEILTVIATILCFLLGVNHFISAITATEGSTALHWMGTIEVLLFGTGFGILAIYKAFFLRRTKF